MNMSSLEEKTRSQSSRAEQATEFSRYEHVPPPVTAGLKDQSVNSKSETLKAIAESMFINKDFEEKRIKERGNPDGTWEKTKMSYIEYLFYKVLLISLYIMYGTFRYCQFQYNMMKLRIFNVYYNPSNTPQLIRQDVSKLNKIPKRLAAILEVKPVGEVGGGVRGLLNDGSKIVCWTVSAGIKHLTIYDYDGLLQKNVQSFREEIYIKLCKYYGPTKVPRYSVRIPHSNKIYYNNEENEGDHDKIRIEISLLSSRDGRETIVDLTKTMADLVKNDDLKTSDITMDLVDSELIQLVGDEPDLLLYFGPALDLQGFPPWHIRLTEFYWETDNNAVVYSVFIRGLKNFAGAKMNVGK